jgi:hypothetical protein
MYCMPRLQREVVSKDVSASPNVLTTISFCFVLMNFSWNTFFCGQLKKKRFWLKIKWKNVLYYKRPNHHNKKSKKSWMIEETRGLVVRQKTHDREVLGSNPRWGDHFSCTIHLDQIMETNLITWHCSMCCNPANGRVDFVDGWHIYLHQGYKHFVGG